MFAPDRAADYSPEEIKAIFEQALTCPRTGEALAVGRFLCKKNFLTVEEEDTGNHLVLVTSFPPEQDPSHRRGGFEEVYRWTPDFEFVEVSGIRTYSNGDVRSHEPPNDPDEILNKLIEKYRISPNPLDYADSLSPTSADGHTNGAHRNGHSHRQAFEPAWETIEVRLPARPDSIDDLPFGSGVFS